MRISLVDEIKDALLKFGAAVPDDFEWPQEMRRQWERAYRLIGKLIKDQGEVAENAPQENDAPSD